jgi:glycosyltransferase involved in cell wall biosynthesis
LANRANAHWLKTDPGTLLAVPPELNYYRYGEQIERTIRALHLRDPWSFIYQRFSLHNFLGPWLGQRLNVPAVVEYNGSEAWTAQHWGTPLVLGADALFVERVALSQADLIVTVSDALAHDLLERGIQKGRILVYPNCVDPAVFNSARFGEAELRALRKQHNIPTDAFVVGFIGTFGQWHGADFLATCINELFSESPEWVSKHKLHFMLVGDGARMPVVRQILADGQADSCVTLTGLVPQVEAPKYLACADLLVAPHIPNADGSEFFGSPTKLFEYMAMEKPVLASALGQLARVISGEGATEFGRLPDGVGRPCGLLFEPGNSVAFKRDLRRLVEDCSLAVSLAHSARGEILARYTWRRHVGAILERMAELDLLDPNRK